MLKPLVAEQKMKEFDPECERHQPLLIIKTVDPGCTLELQIENCKTGVVTRLTSTDDASQDRRQFLNAIEREFLVAWNA
jgi:hypothetical protein